MNGRVLFAVAWLACSAGGLGAWDYEGHRLINLLALESLPTNFPAWVREPEAVERIAYLSGEPDRWRNVSDLCFKHATAPDHYIDIEELADYGLKPEGLPIFRGDFIAHLAVVRRANPSKFPEIPEAKNQDHTRELVGLVPWTMAENVGWLKSGFSCLKAFEENGGSPQEIANAKANIIYVMGLMGHFVADAAQPLHTTIHHHGWVGDNPERYTTNRNFHSWIDGGYFGKVGLPRLEDMKSKLRPAQKVMLNGREARTEEVFQAMALFVLEQNKLTEKLYQLEKEGKLSGNGTKGLEGKPFLEGQFLKAAQLIGDCWMTAWELAPPDTFLNNQLAKRKKQAR